VVVLSGRPARVKVVHNVDITAASPIAARSDISFSGYFHALCAELDIQTEKTA
jgi:NitT/TauT family transport system ATP-binding protein